MSPQTWWYLARASGYVAWGLATASVISGLLFSTRLTNGRPTPAWILDLHRFVGGLAVTFTGLHVAGLVADSYVHFGATDVLVPFASGWQPGAVALGVVAMYLLAAVEVTSLLMRHLPRKLWRRVHLASYLVFWLATFHLLTAGTDAANPVSRLATALAIAVVVFLTLVRALSGRGRRPQTPRSRPEAPPAGRRNAPRTDVRTAPRHPTTHHTAPRSQPMNVTVDTLPPTPDQSEFQPDFTSSGSSTTPTATSPRRPPTCGLPVSPSPTSTSTAVDGDWTRSTRPASATACGHASSGTSRT